MKKHEEKQLVEEVVVEEVDNAKEVLAQARKAKLKAVLERSKKIAIEVVKYSVPAIITGVVVKNIYDKPELAQGDILEGEFEHNVIEENEVVVEEVETGE